MLSGQNELVAGTGSQGPHVFPLVAPHLLFLQILQCQGAQNQRPPADPKSLPHLVSPHNPCNYLSSHGFSRKQVVFSIVMSHEMPFIPTGDT